MILKQIKIILIINFVTRPVNLMVLFELWRPDKSIYWCYLSSFDDQTSQFIGVTWAALTTRQVNLLVLPEQLWRSDKSIYWCYLKSSDDQTSQFIGVTWAALMTRPVIFCCYPKNLDDKISQFFCLTWRALMTRPVTMLFRKPSKLPEELWWLDQSQCCLGSLVCYLKSSDD